MRYRINGAINQMQVSGGANMLLTIEDKLINGGYVAEPEYEQAAAVPSGDKPVFCGQCGAKNTSSVKFCPSCGERMQ